MLKRVQHDNMNSKLTLLSINRKSHYDITKKKASERREAKGEQPRVLEPVEIKGKNKKASAKTRNGNVSEDLKVLRY